MKYSFLPVNSKNQMQISHLRISKPLFWSEVVVVHPATQEELVLLQNPYCASPHPVPCVDRLGCHGPRCVQIVAEWVEVALGCAASCCWPPNVPLPISALALSLPLPHVRAYEPVRPDGPTAPCASYRVTNHSQYKTKTGEVSQAWLCHSTTATHCSMCVHAMLLARPYVLGRFWGS
jgi:hypothetical protein